MEKRLMLPQWGALLLGWALAMAWFGYARSTIATDADLWRGFQRSAEPVLLDALILRGAFGHAGIPELADWTQGKDWWRSRVRALHPLEAQSFPIGAW